MHGFINYETWVDLRDISINKIKIHDLHDYALVFLNGKYFTTLDRHKGEDHFDLNYLFHGRHIHLELLVGAYGRINFGPNLFDRKGITDHVTIRGNIVTNWTMTGYPL